MTEATDLQLAQAAEATDENQAPDEDQQPAEDQQATDQQQAAESAEAQADEGEEVPVSRPAAGETVTFPAAPNVSYVVAFDPTEAQVQIDGNNFVLLFDDGARIVFANLVLLAGTDQAPSLLVQGTSISSNLIVAQAQALAGELPTLETAAGNPAPAQTPQGSGENRYSDDLGHIIDTLQAQPAIPYVERSFGLIQLEEITPTPLEEAGTEPILPSISALPAFGTVGDQFLPPRSPEGSQFDPASGPGTSSDPNAPDVAFSGTLTFDHSNEGTITALQLSGGTSVAPVGPGGDSITVTYDGFTYGPITADEGDFLFVTPLGNVLFVDHETGEYLYVLADNEQQPGVGQSGAADTIEEQFGYTVTDSFEQTASATLTIDIQDDAPTAVDEALLKVYEGGTVVAPDSVLENDTQGADGTDAVASIGVTGDASDQVAIGSAPVSIVGTYGTLTINSLGEYSYAADDLGDPAPADPTDSFVYTIIDEDGDSSQATITILVKEGPTGGLAVAAGQAGNYVPEDVPTDLTLTANTGGSPLDPNDGLTQIVVDFGEAIDLDGSDPETQWQLDPADLAAILALPEVTAVDLTDGGSVLTITLNGTTQTFSADLTMTTPDDSDVDLDGVTVTVTAVDTVYGSTGTGSTSNDIVADAIVDGSEVLRNGSIIDSSNDQVGTNINAAVLLGLTLELGLDSTDQDSGGDISQGDSDGSTLADATEEVILVTVQIDQGASLSASTAATSEQDLGGGVTLYSFDTTGLTEGQVSALVASFEVTPALDSTDDIAVTIETTTRELNTPPATTNAPSGDEINTADNVDVDSYALTVKIVDNPTGSLAAASSTDGYIPEDTETPVTLSATVADPTDTNEVLTQITVDFGLAVDLDGSDPTTQWQLDPASLATILALPEVTAVDLTDGGSVLTITLNGTTQTFAADLLLTPPLDSDVDLTDVEVAVTAEDTALGITADGSTLNDVTVDAIVDGSEIVVTTAPSGLQNQFAAIDLNTELHYGEDSTNVGNSSDPSQAGVTDGTTVPDATEFVSSIVVEVADKDSGTPTGTLEFQDPLPSGVTVTEDAASHTWTFEIASSASHADVQALVESFEVRPDFNYSGTLEVDITTTTEELNTPPGSTLPASGSEANTADNIDIDSYSIDVEVEPITVHKQIDVSGGEPKPFNICFIIDRSGSMDQTVAGSGGQTKFEIAEEAFRTLIADIRDQGIDVANVRIIGFNTGTLDVTDFTSLPSDAQLDAFFAALGDPNGGTRYEPPLQSAAQFLAGINDSNPGVEYDNRIFFLSDGGNNNSAGGFLLGTSNGNDNSGAFDDLAKLYGNTGDVGTDIANLTIKSVGFGIDKAFQGDAQQNLPGSTPVNAYLALDQSDDNMVNGSAIVSDANNGSDLAASFGNVVDPSLATGNLFEGHTLVGDGVLDSFSHLSRTYDALVAIDNADRDAAAAGDVVANDGSSVTIKTENGGFLTVWFADQGGNLEGDFRYEGPPNYPGERTDTFDYVVQDTVGLQLGELDVVISGQAPANGDFENGNLVDWDHLGSVYVEDNAGLSHSNPSGGDHVAVLATNNANGLDPRDVITRGDEGVVSNVTMEDGNLTPVEDLGKDSDLLDFSLYDQSDLQTFMASNGVGTNSVDLSGLVTDDLLDGAVIQTSFALDPLFGTPGGNQNLSISFDWNFATDEGAGGQNDIAFAVVEGQLVLLGSVDGSSFTGGSIDVGEDEVTYSRSTGWQTTTVNLGSDFTDVGGDNVIHVAFGVMDGGSDIGDNSALLLDNVQADVS